MQEQAIETAYARVYALAVGHVLREHRERSRLKQGDVARSIGASQTILSRWELGKSVPSSLQLKQMADAVGVSTARVSQEIDDVIRRLPQAFSSVTGVAMRSDSVATAHDARERLGETGLSMLVGVLASLVVSDPSSRKEASP